MSDWDPTPPPEGATEAEWLEWANGLPITKELGFVCSEIRKGNVVAEVEKPVFIPNPNGSAHGGLQLAIADHVMGIAGASAAPPGHVVVTSRLSSSFHRPAMCPLTVRARVTSVDARQTHVELEMENARGEICTRAEGAMTIQDMAAVTRPG